MKMSALKASLLIRSLSSLIITCFCLVSGNLLADEASGFRMPAYSTFVLDNGLTVNLMQQREVPLISLNAVVRTGAVNDSQAGIASLTAKGLLLGAEGKTKLEIEQAVDFIGARIRTDAGKEGSYVSASFMAKDTATMLPLVKAVLTSPDFDAEEVDKLKQREVADLSRAKESPRSVIGQYFDQLLFGDHPYGNATSGDRESLAGITAKDLADFHTGFYQPSNTALNVVGDFEVEEIRKHIEALFSDWKNTAALAAAELDSGLPSFEGSRVLLVDKGDANESTFIIGGMGIRRDNPDFVGITVINTILGGRFTSWLNDELRVNAGLTYGARSGFSSWSEAGVFQISTFTKTATTREAIDLALKTYARLWEKGVDKETLDSAKAYVKGQFPPRYETTSALAGLLSDMYLYGFDADFINQFEAKVDNLTVETAERLIADYFPRENLQMVIIGKAAEIAAVAADYGEVQTVDIKAVGFKP
jgi:predicted Zn-dependent peptidase